jgi:hypothetical protein
LEDDPRPVLANCDDSESKDLLVEHGWARQRLEREELYDLVFDPNEGRNVAGDPDNAAVLAELRRRLEAWMEERGDPILEGPIPPPPGATYNDPRQVSPAEPAHRAPLTADPTVAPSR